MAKRRTMSFVVRSPPRMLALREAALRNAARLLEGGQAHHSKFTAVGQVAVGLGTGLSYAQLMAEFHKRTLIGMVFEPKPEAVAQRLR